MHVHYCINPLTQNNQVQIGVKQKDFDDKLLVQNMNDYFCIGTLKNVLCKKININQSTNFNKQ